MSAVILLSMVRWQFFEVVRRVMLPRSRKVASWNSPWAIFPGPYDIDDHRPPTVACHASWVKKSPDWQMQLLQAVRLMYWIVVETHLLDLKFHGTPFLVRASSPVSLAVLHLSVLVFLGFHPNFDPVKLYTASPCCYDACPVDSQPFFCLVRWFGEVRNFQSGVDDPRWWFNQPLRSRLVMRCDGPLLL